MTGRTRRGVQLELDLHELCGLLLLYGAPLAELSDVSRADLARARVQLEAALLTAAATRPTLPTKPPRNPAKGRCNSRDRRFQAPRTKKRRA